MKYVWEGLFKKNPVFVLVLGLVPAVAVTSTALNGLYLGIFTAAVLFVAALIDYAATPFVPGNVRPTVGVLVSIILVTVLYGMVLTINPALVASLGIFLPLIAVHGVTFKPCENEKKLPAVLFSAIGQGLGFTLALVILGVIREFLGLGAIFGQQVLTGFLPPMALASTVPGGLIILGLVLALVNKVSKQGGELHD